MLAISDILCTILGVKSESRCEIVESWPDVWTEGGISGAIVHNEEIVRVYRELFVDGQWRAADGPSHVAYSSRTGEPVAEVPEAAPALIDEAVRAAAGALQQWSATAPARRAALLERVADALAGRADEIAAAVSEEVGMPLRLSQRLQAAAPVESWRANARYAASLEDERRIAHSRIVREPVGVVVAITPWNYPLHQITAKVAAALAAGATVVLKPSEVAPTAAFILAECIAQAGLPAGVFNLLTGAGPTVGESLVRHPLVAMVSFTGSTAAGVRVAELAAAGMRRVTLELGGKSASIVLEGADLAKAVKATLASCMLNSGQTCNALTRLVVPRELLGEVAELLRAALVAYRVGDPLDPQIRLGPLASAEQAQRVRRTIAAARASGVPIMADTTLPEELPGGYYVAPIVFGPVEDRASILVQDEIFGPVLVVQPHDGVDDAVALANCTRYGLAAAVWAADAEAAMRVARRRRAGQVDCNGAAFNPEAPFGGYGLSGLGRENGPLGVEGFLETKSVQLP